MRRIVGALLLLAVAAIIGRERLVPVPSADIPTLATRLSAPRPLPAHPAGPPPDYLRDPLRFLSRAPSDSLQLLPGIGPVLAERIARARDGKSLFTRWDELLVVRGIGPKKLAGLQRAARGQANER